MGRDSVVGVASHGRGLAAAFLISLAGAASAGSTSDSLQAKLDSIFDAPAWKSSWWGVKVVDLDTSEVLYERNADKAFMPASNMKLVTTAAALAALGPDYRYETKICVNGPVTPDGVLEGDLIIIGSGDPSISNRFAQDHFDDASREAEKSGAVEPEKAVVTVLQSWSKAVKDAGIRRITGAVIADDDVFDDRPRSESWSLSYYPEYYAAESSGLAMNENCWDVVISPGDKVGAPAKLEVPLGTKYVTFRNNIVTGEPLGPGRNSERATTESATGAGLSQENGTTATRRTIWPDPEISIARTLNGNEVTLSGTIPLDRPPYKEWGALHNGTLYGATLFTEELERQGVAVAGGAADVDDLQDKAQRVAREKLRTLHTHQSPPLSELVRIVNKPSQNFYADMIQRSLGVKLRSRVGSFDAGERAIRDVLTSMGLSSSVVSELRMDDGSGLSRQDRVTPSLLVSLLAAMSVQPEPVVSAFRTSLPVMGVDGTLRTRLRGTPAEKTVIAKTGTIGGVRSLSGYLTSADGHKLAFSMLANNFTVPTKAATDAQDEALLLLRQHKVGSSAAKTDGQTSPDAAR